MKKQNAQNKHLLFMLIKLVKQDPDAMEHFRGWPEDQNPLEFFTRLVEKESIQKAKPAEKSTIPPEIEKKLNNAFSDLFFGLAWRYWMQPGTSLASAWMQSLNMLNQIFAQREKQQKNNPGIEYLQKHLEKKKLETQQFIAKHPHTQHPMNVPQDQIAEYKKIGDNSYNSGMKGLNEALKSLKTSDKAAQLPSNIVDLWQKAQQQAIWRNGQQKIYAKAA
ncbi:MAG: hypothetical protein FWE50_00620 [Alphaproteobacteria bacterium]|nr:hypothetical protein [Alphaproteobacteria bacterium]